MKVAFYYHIPLLQSNSGLFLPGYLGVFIDSLAQLSKELILIMHEANDVQSLECNYLLQNKNIKWVNLGKKTPAWHREFFYRRILKSISSKIGEFDILLVRSPSPLAPYFHHFVPQNKICFLIVGDYVDGADHLKSSNLRDRVIYLYLRVNNFYFNKQIKKTNLLVNSPALFEKYSSIAKSVSLIKTTTLSNNDFYRREDTCGGEVLRVIFTGRIDPAKGLFELVRAIEIVRNKFNHNVILQIVGWEQDNKELVSDEMKKLGIELNIGNCLEFCGRKKVGEELNAMYRQADIFVIPSYHEGFPRTIWEAMANCLPVIATRVGGIPMYLTNDENSILIEPRLVDEIVAAINKIIVDSGFRQKLIKNGFEIAKENTLEIQTAKMMDNIVRYSQSNI